MTVRPGCFLRFSVRSPSCAATSSRQPSELLQHDVPVEVGFGKHEDGIGRHFLTSFCAVSSR